jgi:RNA-splicing ligase RtcB
MKQTSLSSMHKQSGASALTILIMVLFFGSLLTLGIKLGPAYMDDKTISAAIESIRDTEGLSRMGPAQIRSLINKRLIVNNVRSLKAEDITIEKNGDVALIKVEYEVRDNIFQNIDTVVHFRHEYEMTGQ